MNTYIPIDAISDGRLKSHNVVEVCDAVQFSRKTIHGMYDGSHYVAYYIANKLASMNKKVILNTSFEAHMRIGVPNKNLLVLCENDTEISSVYQDFDVIISNTYISPKFLSTVIGIDAHLIIPAINERGLRTWFHHYQDRVSDYDINLDVLKYKK